MALGFRCRQCRAVFRDLGQLFDHAEHAHGVVVAEATPEPLTNAERCKLTRQRRIEHDPDFHERERLRVAALRRDAPPSRVEQAREKARERMRVLRGNSAPQPPVAPPQPPVAPPVDAAAEAAPGARVAALAAEWDAASARRTSERQLRRAERRRMA